MHCITYSHRPSKMPVSTSFHNFRQHCRRLCICYNWWMSEFKICAAGVYSPWNGIVDNWFYSIFQTISIKPVSFKFNCGLTVRIIMMTLQPWNGQTSNMHRMQFCFWFTFANMANIYVLLFQMCKHRPLTICVVNGLHVIYGEKYFSSLHFFHILVVVSITCTSLFLHWWLFSSVVTAKFK